MDRRGFEPLSCSDSAYLTTLSVENLLSFILTYDDIYLLFDDMTFTYRLLITLFIFYDELWECSVFIAYPLHYSS
jgi:hypothetical protein